MSLIIIKEEFNAIFHVAELCNLRCHAIFLNVARTSPTLMDEMEEVGTRECKREEGKERKKEGEKEMGEVR